MSEASEMQVSAYRHTATRADQRGFTLIEVVVVMAMVAILAAIAIPNYSEYVLRSHRSSAQSFITDVASRQAQFFLDRRTYAATVAALNLTAPAEVAARYDLRDQHRRRSAAGLSDHRYTDRRAGWRSLRCADPQPGRRKGC
jgi:prepilin-type N-terminal cleavage/methylation domain-containing protein